ncbi:MAG: CBS domain-containing protein [Clostridia bacterium]|nr:CBS domain-containing protein [Clostridia bacterium]
MKVKECMCNDVACVKPDCSLNQVAKLMNEKHVGCIPVCDEDNCICGIVTDRDILLRAVACEKDTKTCKVSDVMTCNVCTCTEDEEMTNAESKMAQNQIRRLPVCDQNNKVIGILTLGDLAQNDREIGKQQVCTTIEEICNCHNGKHAE